MKSPRRTRSSPTSPRRRSTRPPQPEGETAGSPGADSLETVRRDAADCRACELYRDATQTVFGEGAERAEIMLVGEQPGDREDRAGHPFVGPAGGLLNRALEEAGIDRRKVYVTNAVKHFRFEMRGKRRIHKRPGVTHIRACKPWLSQELALVRPKLVVALGAVAAQSLLGADFRLTKHRGEVIETDGLPPVTATVHPSSILRADDEDREEQMHAFVEDLRRAASSVSRARR